MFIIIIFWLDFCVKPFFIINFIFWERIYVCSTPSVYLYVKTDVIK